MRALVRSQQVVSIAGNVFTGGLDEPVFDIHVNAITDPTKRFGSPAAGESHLSIYPSICSTSAGRRWNRFSRSRHDQVCRVAHQTGTGERHLGG